MDIYSKNKENYINQIILKGKKNNIYLFTFLNNINEYCDIHLYYKLLNVYNVNILYNLYNYIYISYNKIITHNKLKLENKLKIIKYKYNIKTKIFNDNLLYFINNTTTKNKEALSIFIINCINNYI